MKKQLKEVDYEDFLDPNYLQDLKRRSQEIARGQSLHQLGSNVMRNLHQVKQIENQHKEELENLAIELVKEQFPIIEKFGIEIDAKLSSNVTVNAPERRKPKETLPDEFKNPAYKRRIINAITQGSAVSTHGIFHMLKDRLDAIDPNLISMYDELGKSNDIIYHLADKNQLANMAIMSNRQGMAAGSSTYSYNNGVYRIIARAQTFPVLVHEITKALFEIISIEGFELDKEKNTELVKYTDTIDSEFDDIINGRDIYSKIRDYVIDNFEQYLDRYPDFLLYFLQELYKVPSENNEFVNLINGILTGQPNRRKLKEIADDVFYDLRNDDIDRAFEE